MVSVNKVAPAVAGVLILPILITRSFAGYAKEAVHQSRH